ncbi:MAG: XrtA/PEP-CTERM system histidine kinase PrsK, partial [Desulfopila sp.]|nr:XrtA/PEP-CTERM system histidine kinase PrsK [Desulfopila sp.]
MLISLFYILNIAIILVGVFGFRRDNGARNLSLSLVQILFHLPFLACIYLYSSPRWDDVEMVRLVFFGETVFTIIWVTFAANLAWSAGSRAAGSWIFRILTIVFPLLTPAAMGFVLTRASLGEFAGWNFTFVLFSWAYLLNLCILLGVIIFFWRLEQFWRPLNTADRWMYKFMMLGCALVCGAMGWSGSYRLTFLSISPEHLQLVAALLLLGWGMTGYAVFRHRLLNRKLFVSRKVVYSFVAPMLLGAYFLGFGFISMIMRYYGIEMSFVFKWLLLIAGLVLLAVLLISSRIRRQVHFFISTHFYINKYEYRDEWLSFTRKLQGVLSESAVVDALRDVLYESLYTEEIYIWLEQEQGPRRYVLIASPAGRDQEKNLYDIAADDIVIHYLHRHAYYDKNQEKPDPEWEKNLAGRASCVAELNLQFISPITIDNRIIGVIGLGPEFTGGRYGYDDFDLLTALGTQAASALLAVRMAEELAHAREQQAWHRLSSFVLHDIKNAATMLSLLRENAPAHIHEPEFQQDMLELVDDTLKRMTRVEQRLGVLRDEVEPNCRALDISHFVRDYFSRGAKNFSGVDITVAAEEALEIESDPELLSSIVENIFINACESGGSAVWVKTSRDGDSGVVLEIYDNGPGIPEELLPGRIFEPFKTTKRGGSGIGLWQVKRIITRLGGTVSAENRDEGGARFVVRLFFVQNLGVSA